MDLEYALFSCSGAIWINDLFQEMDKGFSVRISKYGAIEVGEHQQKKSCIATHHQAFQYYFYITSVHTLANIPLPYIHSQFFFLLNLPHNTLRPISCPGYTYFTLYPFSMPYVA